MSKVISMKDGKNYRKDNAYETMDAWKEEMPEFATAVIILQGHNGGYNTYAINCSTVEALGYLRFAEEMLIEQVRQA